MSRREEYQGEERAHSKAQARADIARRNELIELKALLMDKRVRDLLFRVMSKTGMFSRAFHLNNAQMSFNCGRMETGHFIYGEIAEALPEAWITMQQEAMQRQLDEAAMQEIEQREIDEERE